MEENRVEAGGEEKGEGGCVGGRERRGMGKEEKGINSRRKGKGKQGGR